MKPRTLTLLLIAVLIILMLGGLVVELPFSMNYLQARSFWQNSITIGLIVGAGAALALLQWNRSKLQGAVSRLQLFFSVLLVIGVLTPLILSWVNRIGVEAAGVPLTKVVLESEQARYNSRFGNSRLQKPQASQYLLFFYREGQLYRIQDDQPFFPQAEIGDTITLSIVKGRLGYEWVIK